MFLGVRKNLGSIKVLRPRKLAAVFYNNFSGMGYSPQFEGVEGVQRLDNLRPCQKSVLDN